MGLGMNQIKTKPNINFKFKLFLSFFFVYFVKGFVYYNQSHGCVMVVPFVYRQITGLCLFSSVFHPPRPTHTMKRKRKPP